MTAAPGWKFQDDLLFASKKPSFLTFCYNSINPYPILKIIDHHHSNSLMKGIQFLINDAGEKTSVLIDLEEWGDLWEDFYDVMVSQVRTDEPDVDWDELETEIIENS